MIKKTVYLNYTVYLYDELNSFFFKNMFMDSDHTQDLRPTRRVQGK